MAPPDGIEVSPARDAEVGEMKVRRALPQRTRRTVGAWCFADHFGPADVSEEHGFDVGPHPHMGLATVTWLFQGQVLHRDSLGSEQPIRAGELNLMTSGLGIAHSEESTGSYVGTMAGIQLWLALPDATRNGAPGFGHHTDLPRAEFDGANATVLVGSFGDLNSPARIDWPTTGVELLLHSGPVALPLDPSWEYAAVVVEGEVEIAATALRSGQLGYLGAGRDELRLSASAASRTMLLGGKPLEEHITMWWNFVARSTEELEAAYRSWLDADDRFGSVASTMSRVPSPEPYWRQNPPDNT